MKLSMILILFFSLCSTVPEDGFLNQVKGKIAYDTVALKTKRGVFSSDGKEFTFTGGHVPLKITKAIDQNTAHYKESRVGVVTRAIFTINGTVLTINVENGQAPFDLYLD